MPQLPIAAHRVPDGQLTPIAAQQQEFSMKALLPAIALAILGLCLINPSQAHNLADSDKHMHGHKHLKHPSKLANGHHHFHTTSTKHKLHAHVRNGKIHGMHVKDRKGGTVKVHKKTQRRPRASLGSFDRDSHFAQQDLRESKGEYEVSLQAPLVLMVGFGFFDAWDNVWVWVWFPATWVVGGDGGTDDGGI